MVHCFTLATHTRFLGFVNCPTVLSLLLAVGVLVGVLVGVAGGVAGVQMWQLWQLWWLG